MFFKSLLDHLLRRPIPTPIQSTGQVPETVVTSELQQSEVKTESRGTLSFYLHFFMKDKVAFAGLVMIGVFFAWSIVEGLMQQLAILLNKPSYGWALLPSNPFQYNFNLLVNFAPAPPSLTMFPLLLFGTNNNGEGLFSRILYAAPGDALAPIIIVGSAVLIGMFFGTIAGYVGGWIDEIVMRATDAFLALPGLILAITIAVLIGTGYTSLLIALIIVWWPTYTRFFRAQALTLREKAYVESSKLAGAGSLKIILKHIVPNSIDPVIAYMTLDFGTVILTYAALAFLGIGIGFNQPEWGYDSSIGLSYFPSSWWWSIIPGVVIALVVVAFTLVGDRLQDLVSGRLSY
jgi:peptide/nickel transport system permease protein